MKKSSVKKVGSKKRKNPIMVKLRNAPGIIAGSAALVLVFTASALTRRLGEVIGWGAFQGIQDAAAAAHPDAARRKEAEELINKEGKAICDLCDDEIIKSDHSIGGGWTWESEWLLGFCHISRDHKHRPRVKYTREEGVQNVES